MDEDTDTQREEGDIAYSYYMIDDVTVRPLKQKISLPKAELEVGNTIQLDRIYFAQDKAELLPKSFTQLDELLA